MDILYVVSSNSTTPAATRRRGRPRDTELRARILRAAAALAATDGVDVGFDRIAQAAGASRTTLYRWWRAPHELFLDALLDAVAFSLETDATAPVPVQLRMQVEAAAAILIDPPTGAPLRALAAAAAVDDEARADISARWFAPRRAAARALIERGIADGSIVAADADVLADVLFAPIYHRAFFTGQPLTEQFVASLVRLIETPPAEPGHRV